MPKGLSCDVKEIVLKIHEFFMAEKRNEEPIIPISRAYERSAAATGLSLRSIANIIKEAKLASGSKVIFQPKVRKIRKDKVQVDEELLRRKIFELSHRNESPTIRKLQQVLKEETNFTGSREIIRQHLKKLGFYNKPNSLPQVVTESKSKSPSRASCIKAVRENRLKNNVKGNRQIDNVNETFVDCGPTTSNSLHNKSGDLPQKYLKEQIIENFVPNMKRPILEDRESYRVSLMNKYPNQNDNKTELIEWLKTKNSEIDPDESKAQLLEVVNACRQEPKHSIFG